MRFAAGRGLMRVLDSRASRDRARGWHLRPCLVGPYQRTPLRRMLLRKQRLERNINEQRVPEIRLAIGRRQFHRFGDAVNVLR